MSIAGAKNFLWPEARFLGLTSRCDISPGLETGFLPTLGDPCTLFSPTQTAASTQDLSDAAVGVGERVQGGRPKGRGRNVLNPSRTIDSLVINQCWDLVRDVSSDLRSTLTSPDGTAAECLFLSSVCRCFHR